MANGVLVDTCIWIDFFKDTPSIAPTLHKLIEKDTVYIAGIILFELFQGVKSEKEKAVLGEVFKGISYLEMTSRSWLNAAGLSRDLKQKGVTLPPSDILLAQLAIENSLEIFTIDDHFKRIPGVSLMKN